MYAKTKFNYYAVNYSIHDAQPNDHFKYIVNIHRMLEFHAARQWMSQTYGFTEDIEEDKPNINEHWAFFLKFSTHKIYLQGDEELSWFKIRWGDPR